MKVVHLVNHFWPTTGGVEQYVQDICLRARKRGIESHVICLNRGPHSTEELPAQETWNGIPITRIPFLDLKLYKKVKLPLSLIRDADVIHVHGIGSWLDEAVVWKSSHGKPIILSTHGGIFHTSAHALIKHLYFNLWTRFILGGVDHVIACSANDQRLFTPLTQRITRIDNGVDLSHFKPTAKKDPKRLIYVGRIATNKQIDQLIQACQFLATKNPEFELHIIGEDWEGIQAGLVKKVDELKLGKKIRFHGKLTDAARNNELQRASFFVSASRHEGFGISTIEAMAAGCIPILNRIPPFEEFVDSGKNGLITDFSNPEESATIIARALNMNASEKKRMMQNGHTFIRRYDLETKIDAIVALYRRAREGKK